jgi:hypothetical protein
MVPSDEELAVTMRRAFNDHIEPGSTLIPWEFAADDRKQAWLVCARAALSLIFCMEPPR